MEKVDIQAIATFIDQRYINIVNSLNLNDITPNKQLYDLRCICKYPIDISKTVSTSKSYNQSNKNEITIPIIDINCTPIKIISCINPYSLDNLYNINMNGYIIINDVESKLYKIILNTFNGILKDFYFDSIFYVNFVNIDNINKIGYYNRSDYSVNPEVKGYYQKAIYYLKQEYNVYFDPTKSYLFVDNIHNEIIILKDNIVYRYVNVNVDKFDNILQRFVPGSLNCFEEFTISSPINKELIDYNQYDENYNDQSEDYYDEDYDY